MKKIACFNLKCFPKKIRILDTSLRNCDQAPVISLTPESKLGIAQRLDGLGVEIIETRFAPVSEGEIEAVRLIAEPG
jgi:2-isopropylmalate synthase